MYQVWIALWALFAFVASAPALAQQSVPASEMARLREEMKELQNAYEARMQALEKRLNEAEARTLKAEQSSSPPAAVASSPGLEGGGGKAGGPAARTTTGASGFNPAISLILQGTYARTSQDPNNFAITGFIPSGGEVVRRSAASGSQKPSLPSARTSIRISAGW